MEEAVEEEAGGARGGGAQGERRLVQGQRERERGEGIG
jgi:hypothetical protein